MALGGNAEVESSSSRVGFGRLFSNGFRRLMKAGRNLDSLEFIIELDGDLGGAAHARSHWGLHGLLPDLRPRKLSWLDSSKESEIVRKDVRWEPAVNGPTPIEVRIDRQRHVRELQLVI